MMTAEVTGTRGRHNVRHKQQSIPASCTTSGVDWKLTHLLVPFMGGLENTLMVETVSLEAVRFHENAWKNLSGCKNLEQLHHTVVSENFMNFEGYEPEDP